LSADFVRFIEILSRAVETLENATEFFDFMEVIEAADDVLDVYERLEDLS